MRDSICAAACAALLLVTGEASAQQPAYLAANCANCHGTDGRSAGGIPPLAGIDAGFFVDQMNRFRSGTRIGTVMNQLAKGYTDEQVAMLARYFSQQKP